MTDFVYEPSHFMAFGSWWKVILTVMCTAATILIAQRLFRLFLPQGSRLLQPLDLSSISPDAINLTKVLQTALPDSVITPRDETLFRQSMNAYWAQQEWEVVPACFVRPRSITELAKTVSVLKNEFDQRRQRGQRNSAEGLFAVRSGGHSPLAGAASIKGGILIDMRSFDEVVVHDEQSSVNIGAGARWMDVSTVLDGKGLAVVGGRNSAVGVGGLIVGGGLSFFSPRYGLVCSNVISYDLVLASGEVTTASAVKNPRLWRALKGGSNNFGIVATFTVKCFPCPNVWSGFLYMTSSQSEKALAAFHEFVSRGNSSNILTRYDEAAAGPILSFSHVHALGFTVISAILVHTNPPVKGKKWPACWQTSSFAQLRRLWSTLRVRTLTSATDELNALNPSGRRQIFVNTTIKNDVATLAAAHAAFIDAVASLRNHKIKGLVWTLNLQPLLPEWARKGDPNPLGLDTGSDEPLVIVSCAINWVERQDDAVVRLSARRAFEQIDKFAEANKTGHRYRYLNYCAEWQDPFRGYGEENLQFLRDVSREYDPDGLFQHGCTGGFKLDSCSR